FREFLLRGKNKAKVEFLMMCVVHNIGKIAEALKRGGTNLKETLENVIQGANQSGNDVNNVAMGA
ncbi:MAG: IS5/IS1182 family transposase, partial [Methanosarcinaceae archaeon]